MATARGLTVRIDGFLGFRAALEQATEEIRDRVGQIMEETARDIQADARAYVRGSTRGDGDLADQIIVEGKGTRWAVGVSEAVIPSRGGDRVHQRPFIYGFILEYGSRDYPPEPFMRPAAENHLARFQERLSGAFR